MRRAIEPEQAISSTEVAMKRDFIHGTVCPMCHDIEQNKFVWSHMLNRHICWLCTVELCVDFYPGPHNASNYFLRAAELLGVNEWICRRLYLQEVLMIRAAETQADQELCKFQIDAINEYLKLVNECGEDGKINAARIILNHKLKDRAFRCKFAELVIPCD
jgi:hypothetical protein